MSVENCLPTSSSDLSEKNYYLQYKALQGEISKLKNEVEGNDSAFARKQTIITLLVKLSEYAAKQYCFFVDGFYKKVALELLPNVPVKDSSFTKEYVFGRLIRQMSADLIIIQRAYNDRLHDDAKKSALQTADKLAMMALKPAMDGGVDENGNATRGLIRKETTVLTYFQKSAQARTIPYAPVALIGIPLTCVDQVNNYGDFLAIPHEIGHYVYWHGRFAQDPNEKSIIESAENELSRVSRATHVALKSKTLEEVKEETRLWKEEIFADVYGCLVVGPAIAKKIQALLVDNYTLKQSDGVHPTPAIRPVIFTRVLKKLNAGILKESPFEGELTRLEKAKNERIRAETTQIGETAKALVSNWKKVLKSRGVNRNNFLKQQEQLEGLVDELLASFADNDILVNRKGNVYDPKTPPWTVTFSDTYEEFKSKLPGPAVVDPPECEEGWEPTRFYFDDLYADWKNAQEKGTKKQIEYVLINEEKEKYGGWRQMISRSGWTIGGPDDDGTESGGG